MTDDYMDGNTVLFKRRGHALVPQQDRSFWLGLPRESFSLKAEQHFRTMRLPETVLGVTLQLARKHGTL